MGRKQLVAVLVVVVAVAIAVAVAAASRGGTHAKPAQQPQVRPATSGGLGDDDANVMRRLQRPNLMRSHR